MAHHSMDLLAKCKHMLYKCLYLDICICIHTARSAFVVGLDLTTNYQDLSVQLQNSSREKFTPLQKEILLEFSSSNQAIL